MATGSTQGDSHALKCQNFHHYDFTKDPQFMKGWETISKSQRDKETSLDTQMLTAKVFYYSRFLEPITVEEYQAWLAEVDNTDSTDGEKDSPPEPQEKTVDTIAEEACPQSNEERGLGAQTKVVASTGTGSVQESKQSEACSGDNTSGTQSSLSDAGGQQDPKYPESFVEVMQLVQAGHDIPGLEELRIEATNTPVTESSAARVKKPWAT